MGSRLELEGEARVGDINLTFLLVSIEHLHVSTVVPISQTGEKGLKRVVTGLVELGVKPGLRDLEFSLPSCVPFLGLL